MNIDSDYVNSNSTSMDSIDLPKVENVTISEDEWIELTITIQELVNDILEENIIRISNANVYKEITQATIDVLFETLAHLFTDEDEIFEDIQELAEQMVEIEIERSDIPKRSLTMTLDNLEQQTEEVKLQLENTIEQLRNIPQPQQKTTEWYEFRYNLISASNLWKGFGK